MNRSIPARLYSDLLFKPYREGARGPDFYDCLGLAIEVQRRRGFAVPDFISSTDELHAQVAAGGFLAGCTKLEYGAESGCVALVRMGVNEFHLGTMIDPYRMLHVTAQTRTPVVVRILEPIWQRRIIGFYRLEAAR